MNEDDKNIPEHEGGGAAGGGASGIPAGDMLSDESTPISGVPHRRHWRESTISDDDLTDRGGVFFAAVEMTRMPMILTDPRQDDNPIVFANKAFLDLTGYEDDEVMGRNCRFLQGARTDRAMVAELREAVTLQRPISLEILNYKRDGTPFWNAIFMGPVYGVDGELLYFFASQLDVSRRREAEESHRQAQKMEAVGQLTAGIAHDFNNLLQIVTGNHEYLLADLEAPEHRRRLESAQAAAERASRLTKQLLAFARKTRLDPKPVDVSQAVMGFSELLEASVGPLVDLRLNLKTKLPACLVDLTHLETALLNAVVNARDAMPRGGELVISTDLVHLNGDADARELPSGDYVIISVTDSGVGMSADVLARATEPFFTTKGVGRGTGLGLAQVHGFLQQSRGRLEIESAIGSGTTLRLLLPVPSGEEGQRPNIDHAAGIGYMRGAGETVLVVEDSEDVRVIACDYLEDLGYNVIAAEDADAALRIMADNSIDLLFTDLMMPGSMNGVALAAEVQTRYPDTKILLTTGYNDDLARQGGSNADGLNVVGKPYRRAELADRIYSALHGNHLTERRKQSDFGAAEA